MDLAATINIYDRLRALIPKLEEQKFWYRGVQRADPRLRIPGQRDRGSPRDRLYCALATKATRTHAAVRTVVGAGNAADAMALTRVLIENLVVMMWIRRDLIFRLDAYAASADLHDRRLAYVAQTHFAEINPAFAAKAAARMRETSAMVDLLGGSHHTWARKPNPHSGELEPVSLAEIFDEVFGKAPQAAAGIRSAMYDVAYFKGSQVVHSTVAAVADLIRDEDWYFRLHAEDDEGALVGALGVANIAMAGVLNELQSYLQDGIFEPELEAIARSISALLDARDAPPVPASRDSDNS